jgi:hypothetical protein
MDFHETLRQAPVVMLKQKFEIAELIGFESRNKYVLQTEQGAMFGYAAEDQRDLVGFVLRQVLGHWRHFNIRIFDQERRLVLRAVHPFRFFFSRLEVYDAQDRLLGALQSRWSFFRKRFDFEDARGQVFAQTSSPFWRPWTFVMSGSHGEMGRIEKKWGGLLKEAITDGDKFRVSFSPSLSLEHRQLLVAAGLFVDLKYFEHKS